MRFLAYLNYGASSREDRCLKSGLLRSRSPLRRAAQGNLQERRQSQRTSGFQVAGAPCGLAECNEGDLPKYVCAEWNVDAWLSELRALGCDPASLNKFVRLSKLDPKLANWVLLSFYRRIADGVYSLAPPVRN